MYIEIKKSNKKCEKKIILKMMKEKKKEKQTQVFKIFLYNF